MIYQVKVPILGFEATEQVEITKIDDTFIRITDTKNPKISFTLINPYVLREYSFDVPSPIQVLLDIHQDSKINVYNIIVLQNTLQDSSVNFLAPIIFNEDNQTMGQVVLSSKSYPAFDVADPIANYDKKSA